MLGAIHNSKFRLFVQPDGKGSMNLSRIRFQQGSVAIEKRKTGQDVWIYRWRETSADGTRVKRKYVIGTKLELPSKAAALRAVEALKMDINAQSAAEPQSPLTVGQLIEHYKLAELTGPGTKTARTRQVYEHQLMNIIHPRWGTSRLRDVKPIAVEKWLAELPGAPGSKAKTKGVFSVLFQHAMRYEWCVSNPIRLVRQGAMPVHEQIVLTSVEIAALLAELHNPFRVLILLVAVTGLRRGELIGLKWQDIDFAEGELKVVRSMVDQVEGPPKTLASRRPLPLAASLISALQQWRGATQYPEQEDWVFASPQVLGSKPYWPDAVLKRHVLPAAERAGITKRIGWHTFRRTVATLLHASGASVKTTQDLLRHASPLMTLGTYAKSVTADKRIAQDAIVSEIIGVADVHP